MDQDWLDAIAQEDADLALVRQFAADCCDSLARLWRLGDGNGGGVLELLRTELATSASWALPPDARTLRSGYQKRPIPTSLRWQVFKRDGYRCVLCENDSDLQADHIVAESRGGPTSYENLQTLCRKCNARKGSR